MKNKFNSTEEARALRLRVEKAKAKLMEYGAIKNGQKNFALKYPEYLKEKDWLQNLWYGRSTSEEFTIKLEAFAEFKKVELT